MLLHICSVFDSAAQAYNRPIFVPSTGLAIRSFRDEVNRKADDNTLNSHPSDFELYQVGQFDDQTGDITSMAPSLLARAIDMKE